MLKMCQTKRDNPYRITEPWRKSHHELSFLLKIDYLHVLTFAATGITFTAAEGEWIWVDTGDWSVNGVLRYLEVIIYRNINKYVKKI